MTSRERSGSEGFAAVDALVALLVLSVVLMMSFQALHQAGRVALAAAETRRAETRLSALLQTSPRDFDVHEGAGDGFTWRVETDATGAERPIEVCRRAASLHSEASGRTYKAATLETCPSPVDAPTTDTP